jgi:ribosomal protein L2
MSVNSFEEITSSSPFGALTIKLKKHAGRNNS